MIAATLRAINRIFTSIYFNYNSLANRSMLTSLQKDLYQFLTANQSQNFKKQIKEITAERVYTVLEDKFLDEYDEESVFGQEFFKGSLRKVAEAIMNVVYRKQFVLVKIQQIVVFVSILQHILHEKAFNLPPSIAERVQQYSYYLILMQNIEIMRNIFEDTRNSNIMANFYSNIYKEAFSHRVVKIPEEFGLKLESHQLPHYLLQCIVEQKEGNIDGYSSKVTAQWIILSIVYFSLAIKADIYKQKPVLAKILSKYKSLRSEKQIQRQINGDELCDFYNNIFLKLMGKLDTKQVERLIDQIKTDIDVSSMFIISPIQNQNNTVLDNIIISSSWEV